MERYRHSFDQRAEFTPLVHLTNADICQTSVNMSKKKGSGPDSSIKVPRMVSVRDFVRGGYQDVREPLLVMSQSRALFAVYPVETSPDYLQTQPLPVWRQGPILSPETPPARHGQLVLTPTHEDPPWLTGSVPAGQPPGPARLARSTRPRTTAAPSIPTSRPLPPGASRTRRTSARPSISTSPSLPGEGAEQNTGEVHGQEE